MASEPHADPLALLSARLDSLSREAESLRTQIGAEVAASELIDDARQPVPDGAASAMRRALADSIVPLSAKGGDGIDTPRDRYVESLRRRVRRHQREGEVLAEQMARLSAEAKRLRAERDQLDATTLRLRERAAA